MRFKRSPVAAACVLLPALAAAAAPEPPRPAAPAASTRSLFDYSRDDAAPQKTTRIAIHAGQVGATPVQPGVFGNFIEHLADLVYRVLWANALQNPGLERLEDANAIPPYWDTAGHAIWSDTGGYVSSRSCACPRRTGR